MLAFGEVVPLAAGEVCPSASPGIAMAFHVCLSNRTGLSAGSWTSLVGSAHYRPLVEDNDACVEHPLCRDWYVTYHVACGAIHFEC